MTFDPGLYCIVCSNHKYCYIVCSLHTPYISALSRITPLKPPGGDCHLTVGDNSEEEGELKLHSKVTQPPGGSSSEIFSDSASDISTSSESSVVPTRKPYR